VSSDNARAREAHDWLGKAADDLGSCRALMVSGYWGNALFFCQQAAEKSLKAFLTFHDRTLRRTHDIEQLGETCCLIDGTLASLLEEADVLSEYAWKLRYPGAQYTPGRPTEVNVPDATREVAIRQKRDCGAARRALDICRDRHLPERRLGPSCKEQRRAPGGLSRA
jgi:HEPN domain-containing protein